jgi:uncharacterized membrane protein YbhN (UPF0104 family)
MIQFFALVPKRNLFLSALFVLMGKLCLVFLPKFSLEKEGFKLSYLQVFFIVTITQLGKYIPGGVWHFVGRYNAYQNQDISIKKSTKAIISENIWLLSGAIAVGTLFGINSKLGHELLSGIKFPTQSTYLIIYAIVISLCWIALLIIYESFLNQKFPTIHLSSIIKLISVQFVTWTFLGISFLLIFPEFSMAIAPDVIFGYSISWAIGYVMVFAPGGIGIREGALVWIFSSLFITEDILIYSTVHRFLYVAVEFIMGFFSMVARPSLITKSNNNDLVT